MKKKLIKSIISFVLLGSLLISGTGYVFYLNQIQSYTGISSAVSSSMDNHSWLKEINGVRVLHLQGTPYEMGYQYGTLLKEDCLQNLRAYKLLAAQIGFTYEDFLFLWNVTKEYVSQKYIDEMQGLADAVGISFEQVAIGNVLTMWVHCSGFSLWGPATASGDIIHGSSLDYPIGITDPISGETVQDNFVTIIREPVDGYASLDPSYAGLTGSVGGINENGIAINVHSCWSFDETNAGTPMVFRLREVLDRSSSIQEARNILDENKTKGWNFILSDSNIPQGFAMEQTANIYYVGTWNHPTESNPPFWPIDSVVRRTNIFINYSTADTQRVIYNPKVFPVLGFFGVNNLGWSNVNPFTPWTHYKTLSDAIEDMWGSFTINNSMAMFRSVYNGNTSPLFNVLQSLEAYTALHQWVATPSTGDILVSVARDQNSAFTQSVHHLNLFQLLEYEL